MERSTSIADWSSSLRRFSRRFSRRASAKTLPLVNTTNLNPTNHTVLKAGCYFEEVSSSAPLASSSSSSASSATSSLAPEIAIDGPTDRMEPTPILATSQPLSSPIASPTSPTSSVSSAQLLAPPPVAEPLSMTSSSTDSSLAPPISRNDALRRRRSSAPSLSPFLGFTSSLRSSSRDRRNSTSSMHQGSSTPSLSASGSSASSNNMTPPVPPSFYAAQTAFDPTPTYSQATPNILVTDLLPPSYHTISEHGQKYTMVAAVPNGMTPKDILQVFVFDDAREVGFAGSDQQMGVRIKVPVDANLRSVKATVADGVLRIDIGKMSAAAMVAAAAAV